MQLDIPSNGISLGTLFGYDASSESFLLLGNSWTTESGSLLLSSSGDNVMVYCLEENDSIHFLHAAMYLGSWSRENSDPAAFSSNESALPRDLPENCSVNLKGKKKNWWYRGDNGVTLDSISNQKNWDGDNNSSSS